MTMPCCLSQLAPCTTTMFCHRPPSPMPYHELPQLVMPLQFNRKRDGCCNVLKFTVQIITCSASSWDLRSSGYDCFNFPFCFGQFFFLKLLCQVVMIVSCSHNNIGQLLPEAALSAILFICLNEIRGGKLLNSNKCNSGGGGWQA